MSLKITSQSVCPGKGEKRWFVKHTAKPRWYFWALAPSRGFSPGGSSPGAAHPHQEVSRCGSAGRLTPPRDFCWHRSGQNRIYFFMSKDADVPSVEPNPTWQGPSRRRELTSLLGPSCPQCAICVSFPREQRGLNHDTSHLPSMPAISCKKFPLSTLEK